MRINEVQTKTDLFEDAVVDQILDTALATDQVWSKPMTAEEAIAITLGKPMDKNGS
jgi:hypothetical protein